MCPPSVPASTVAPELRAQVLVGSRHESQRNPARLRVAFFLAALAFLSTLLLLWIGYLHFCLVAHRLVVPWLRWMAAPLLLRVAYFDSLFFLVLYVLLGFNAACGLGALWLALRR